jgi:hypothetical protein
MLVVAVKATELPEQTEVPEEEALLVALVAVTVASAEVVLQLVVIFTR